MDHRGSGRTRYSGELVARAAGNIALWKGVAISIDQYAPVFLPEELPSLTEKPGRPQSSGYKELDIPLSMGFSRQEYWSGLPFPSPGDLPNSGIEPESPALQADALPSEPPGKPIPFYG